MQRQNRIPFENALAKSMLLEITHNSKIKSVLTEIATALHSQVFSHAAEAINKAEPAMMKDVMRSWSVQHSEGDKYLGALLPNHSQEELRETSLGRALLLSAMEKTLAIENIEKINTLHDAISLIKTLDGLGYYYLSDAYTKSNCEEYSNIKNMIYPSAEEAQLRASRTTPMQAVTYGIGTEPDQDLIPQAKKEIESCFSGKARFFIAASEKMPWFQQLAREEDSLKPLPLVASASMSTARLLITLLHLGVFQRKDRTFDLEKAQIFANCLMGYYVFCGHHSFVEVMEIWNRLLDYIAIYHSEQLPAEIYAKKSVIEESLPYGCIGDYKKFLHVEYAKHLLETAEFNLKNQHKWLPLAQYAQMFRQNANQLDRKIAVESILNSKCSLKN